MKKLDKVYKNVDEMKAAGFTAQDLDAIKNAPRSKNEDYENDHSWFPEVNGFKLIYTLWTDAEREHYRAYKARHTGSGTGRPSKTATVTRNQEYFDWVLKNQGDDAAYQYLKMIVPNDPLIKVYEKFKTFNPTKITAADLISLLG